MARPAPSTRRCGPAATEVRSLTSIPVLLGAARLIPEGSQMEGAWDTGGRPTGLGLGGGRMGGVGGIGRKERSVVHSGLCGMNLQLRSSSDCPALTKSSARSPVSLRITSKAAQKPLPPSP